MALVAAPRRIQQTDNFQSGRWGTTPHSSGYRCGSGMRGPRPGDMGGRGNDPHAGLRVVPDPSSEMGVRGPAEGARGNGVGGPGSPVRSVALRMEALTQEVHLGELVSLRSTNLLRGQGVTLHIGQVIVVAPRSALGGHFLWAGSRRAASQKTPEQTQSKCVPHFSIPALVKCISYPADTTHVADKAMV